MENRSKIFLFGSNTVKDIPVAVDEYLRRFANEGYDFIVGDRNNCDKAFHRTLGNLGLKERTQVYKWHGSSGNNYGFPELDFSLTPVSNGIEGEPDRTGKYWACDSQGNKLWTLVIKDHNSPNDSEDYRRFLNRKMAKDCTFAICLYDGKQKQTVEMMQFIQAAGKFFYMFRVEV